MPGALPNLHPALVHFPIVLLMLALVVDLAAVSRPGWRGAAKAAVGTWGLAALSATATWFSGRVAADGLSFVPALAQPAIGEHADLATALVLLSWAVFGVRAAAERLSGPRRKACWGLGLVLGIAAQGVLVVTADKGGALVYTHGLAVQVVGQAHPPPAAPQPAVAATPSPEVGAEDPASGPTLEGAESLRFYVPTSSSLAAAGFDLSTQRGASVRVDGTQELLFPDNFGDVQVNAWLGLSDFEGQVSLLHHVSESGAGALVLHTNGDISLRALAPDPEALDGGRYEITPKLAVAVSAAGSHLKGLVNGATAVHGHAPALPPGQVGLRFEGSGDVRIERIEVVPLAAH